MRVKPTKATLAAAYTMLRSLPPFADMKLPPADMVQFRTPRAGNFWGKAGIRNGRYVIWITEHQTLPGLVATMAHEMIHLSQDAARTCLRDEPHNADFGRRSRRVCAKLGIEVGGF